MDAEQQLKVLARIWGRDREGYVFLPWISGKAKDKAERRKSFHEGTAFVWPADQGKILSHLRNHQNDDMYFAPCLFEGPRRVEQYAAPERALWADLDEVDPDQIDINYRPTIAWESSPGRYQGVWLLSKPRIGMSWAGKENHRLTVYLGADPSGWDTTQLLRVPGRLNHKPDHRAANAGEPVAGRLLWDSGPRYTPDGFDDLPEVSEAPEAVDTELLSDVLREVDRHEVWARIRLKVNPKIREYMSARDDGGADRSNVLWQIERELADNGCTLAEIVAVVRPTIWNKYAGRNDELKRLQAEASKALKARSEQTEDDADILEVVNEDKPEMRWLHDAMAVRIARPKWLVKNVWSRGGCGFISGDPKSYKSWTALDLVLSVATGTPFLGEYPVIGGPQAAMYVQEEDGEIIVRSRVEQVLEGKAPDLHWDGQMVIEDGQVFWYPPTMPIPLGFHVRSGFTASDPGWQVWLEEILGDYQAAMCVIDTMGTTAGEVDTDRASEVMAKILRPLKQISETTKCAIPIVHHNKKSADGNQRGGARMLGSVALHAWVDDALYVHSREKAPHGASKIRMERESKSGIDARWVVEIPHMREVGNDGQRVVWSPVTGVWQESEPEVIAKKISHTNGRPAGSDISWRVGQMGRNVTLDRIMEVLQITKTKALDQLNSAVKNGLMEGDEVNGWSVTSHARARV